MRKIQGFGSALQAQAGATPGLVLAQVSLVLINYTCLCPVGKPGNLLRQVAACEQCWHLRGCIMDAPNGA